MVLPHKTGKNDNDNDMDQGVVLHRAGSRRTADPSAADDDGVLDQHHTNSQLDADLRWQDEDGEVVDMANGSLLWEIHTD